MKIINESKRFITINLTKKQAEILLDMLWPYQQVGGHDLSITVSSKQYDIRKELEEALSLNLYENI